MSRHTSPSHRTNPNAIAQFPVPKAPTSSPLAVDIYNAPAAQVASACCARRAHHLALALLILAVLVGTLLFALAYPVSQAHGWVDVDVTDMAQAWVADSSANHGLVLLPQAATGSVTYSFCSELGWSPCTQAQAPVLKVWHHQPTPEPTPELEPEP